MPPQNDSGDAFALELQKELGEQDNCFAVEPITNCPHLPTSTASHPVHIHQSCQACDDAAENWQCLTCHIVLCSRYRQAHMQDHVKDSGHFVCLSYADLSVWCFACDSYVAHENLDDLKHRAYVGKFNEEPPTLSTAHLAREQDQPSSSS